VSSGNWASASIRANRSDRLQTLELRRILAPRGHPQITERDGIEVVVGERDESEAPPPQIHDFVEYVIHQTRPRTLAIRSPDRAERAVLRATAHRLHRAPHVTSGWQQVPPTSEERLAFDSTTGVLVARSAGHTVAENLGPYTFTVAGDNGVRATEFAGLVGKE